MSDIAINELASELALVKRRQQSDEAQLVKIASYIGKDATDAPQEDRSIAGLVIAELKRLTSERDAAIKRSDELEESAMCNRLRLTRETE